MITLAGTALPSPSHLTVRYTDARGKTGINTLGNIVRDNAAMKCVAEAVFPRLEEEQGSLLHTLAASGGTVTAVLPLMQGEVTMECVCTGLESDMLRCENGVPVWRNVRLTLEEV